MALRENSEILTKSRRSVEGVALRERFDSGIRISGFGHCFKRRRNQNPGFEPTSRYQSVPATSDPYGFVCRPSKTPDGSCAIECTNAIRWEIQLC